jgi:hypothetical protein
MGPYVSGTKRNIAAVMMLARIREVHSVQRQPVSSQHQHYFAEELEAYKISERMRGCENVHTDTLTLADKRPSDRS